MGNNASMGGSPSRRGSAIAIMAAAILAASPVGAEEPSKSSWIAEASPPAAAAWRDAQDVSAFALGLIGVEYRYGGTSPEAGLDCSGLIRYVFEQVTGATLPRTSRELALLGNRVSLSDLEPGDLVFFNTRRFAFSHVGLYLGNERFIHAPSRGREVAVASLGEGYWKKRFDGARRLIGVLPSLVPSLITPAIAAQAPANSPPLNAEPATPPEP
jgi:cell wall-associated NlpC family hydrolase